MSIRSKIQSLITAANNTTGESDTTLTDAVQTLVDGYGQGGGGGSDIVSVSAETIGNFGYSDIPTIYPKLKYKNSILIFVAIGDTPPTGVSTQFPYTFIRHAMTQYKAVQWYGSTSNSTPTRVVNQLNSLQGCDDISINGSGYLSSGSARKFCGAGCTVTIIEIPITYSGEYDNTLWE